MSAHTDSNSTERTRPALHLTLTEKLVAALALLISTLPGLLFALWMPSREVGAIFGTLWGTLLGALIVAITCLRLHDRTLRELRAVSKAQRQAALRHRPLPSYTITPENSPHASRSQALSTPLPPLVEVKHPPFSEATTDQHQALPYVPVESRVTLEEPRPSIPEVVTDLPVDDHEEATQEERQLTTEKLSQFSDPASASAEETFNEIVRTTANLDVPGAVLMSMADLDAEMTRQSPTRKHASHMATRPFNTPAPLLAEASDPEPDTSNDVSDTSQDKLAQHFANRATAPLDISVIQSFASDQRSTQRIDDIPALVSQELRRDEATSRVALDDPERTAERSGQIPNFIDASE